MGRIPRLTVALGLMIVFASADGRARTLVILSGGYQSCPATNEALRYPGVPEISALHASAADFLKTLRFRDPEVEVVWSCYSGVLKRGTVSQIIGDVPLDFRFGTVTSKGLKTAGSIPVAVSKLDGGGPLDPFYDFIRSRVANGGAAKLYLAGHSSGGWTVLQLGTRLAEEKTPVDGVLLLDALSPVQCHINAATWNRLTGQGPDPACNRAPADLVHSKMAALRVQPGWRLNIYQRDNVQLRSGRMQYPGWQDYRLENVRGTNPHSHLALDPRVWQRATDRVLAEASERTEIQAFFDPIKSWAPPSPSEGHR